MPLNPGVRMWVRGIIGAAIGGGAAAVSAGMVMPAIDKTGAYSAMTAGWYEMVFAMFTMNAVMGAFLYLKQHNLPDDIVTTQYTTAQTAAGTTIQQVTERREPQPAPPLPALPAEEIPKP